VYQGQEAQTRLDVLVLLDLSENKLESLPEDSFFFWMNCLRELNLSHNRLQSLPVSHSLPSLSSS
jgi:Leucine-rich repeat (LRR) protein